MIYLKEKLKTIFNRLSTLLAIFKRICVTKFNDIPIKINEVIVGVNKLGVYLDEFIEYEIDENDIDYLSSINSSMFANRSNLIRITIPNSVTSIEYDTFENCTGLISITIPDSVTSIGSSAFKGCISLTSITIPNSVTSIKYNTFENCPGLTSITIPDSVTSIGEYAFRDCTGLQSVTIGDSVTSIGNYTFYDCTNLTSITIPDSVTSIGNYAFGDCTNLQSVTIGNGVTSIEDIFFSCNNLTDIYFKPILPPSLSLILAIPGHATIHVPIGSGDAYKSATNWSYHSDRIVEDIEI